MKRDPRTIFHDILTTAKEIQEFTAGLDAQSYAESIMTRKAVERNFEIIGECLNRLRHHHPNLANQVPRISKIINFRNMLSHEYDVLNQGTIWRIIKEDLPDLEITIRKLMNEFDHQ